MKEILEFAGAVLYVAFSILTFPLLVFTHCLLELWSALKFAKGHQGKWRMALKGKRKLSSPMPNYFRLALLRIRSMLW